MVDMIKPTKIYSWFTLATIEGDGFAYVNPNSPFYPFYFWFSLWEYTEEDRYTFETYEEAKEFRDERLDCPEAICILKETRQIIEEDEI